MTVDEVVDLDLGYAPPFGPVWDPVHLVAARRLLAAAGRGVTPAELPAVCSYSRKHSVHVVGKHRASILSPVLILEERTHGWT